ncbi:MAG: hypothetical protein E4H27_06655 [Anaerolineales bacterium]|nr:MAG: hypothetical protein E4H27_06655 [Anaerolineales bacterium]
MENKWPGIKEAFRNFDIQVVADFKEEDIEALTTDTRVVRNWRKLEAVVWNAQKILELDKKHGSFQNYLRSHGNFEQTLKAMRKDFIFMGPFGVYVFLYTIGEDVIPHEEFQRLYRK